MIATDAIAALEAALDANPENWPLRLVLADALDEIGETVRGNGQRWMGVERKRPHWGKHWYKVHDMPDRVDPISDLPCEVYDALGCGFQLFDQGDEENERKIYDARPAAELALACALHELGIVAEVPR